MATEAREQRGEVQQQRQRELGQKTGMRNVFENRHNFLLPGVATTGAAATAAAGAAAPKKET